MLVEKNSFQSRIFVQCTVCPLGGTFVYRSVFIHILPVFTFDGACSLYRSFVAWPEIAKF